MKRALIIIVVLSLVSAIAAVAAESAADKEKAAVEVAKKWLALVDAGKYSESWTEAATLFRNAVTKEQWAQQVGAVRKPLGDMKSRDVSSAKYTTTAPGAPDGEYVIIQFKSSFANKKDAVETVTPMKDKDGAWRVSGYYIK